MTLDHVKWWQSEIQPVIDDLPNRADKYWNLVLIAASSSFIGKFISRKPIGITIGIKVDEHFVPEVLMQLVSKFPYFDTPNKKSSFVWYLSVAPKEALLHLKDVKLDPKDLPKRIGSIALHTALVYSMNHAFKGRVILHADDDGGDQLLDWYVARGMETFPEEADLNMGLRGIIVPNDGRYCYYSDTAALDEIKEFDSLR